MGHHAYVIAGDNETGISATLAVIERELGMNVKTNPDVIVLRYGLLTVEDARKIISIAQQGPLAGEHKAIAIAASRMYHEAQNALLKLFEEPPADTTLFLIVPEIGQLLPTLRSRVAVLPMSLSIDDRLKIRTSGSAEEFLKMSREKRSAFIKKLVNGADEEDRRVARDEALSLVNDIEAVVFMSGRTTSRHWELLEDIQFVRGYLHDRSAPLKMILEHISLILPRNLL